MEVELQKTTMKIKFYTLILVLFLVEITNAQMASIKKVPKQYSLEFGYRNVFSETIFRNQTEVFNQASHGYGVLFDYAWQLSGFDGKKAKSFISVPMGYTMIQADNDASQSVSMLNYGWTVRHELKKHSNTMPFVGYGLFLNDLRFKNMEGSAFGHQTQFEFGYNFNNFSKIKYFAKIQYSYTSYPQFDEAERIKYHFADFRIGMRF